MLQNLTLKPKYPLARNQYINNSPEIFSCIRVGANTGATCIRTEMNSLKNLANMRKMIPQKYFPVFAQKRTLRAQILKNFKILKFSSEPPTKPLFFVGNSGGQD